MTMTATISLKTCVRCEISQPHAEFYRAARNLDGLKKQCRTCSTAQSSEWNRSHPEQRRKWRNANRPRIKAQEQAWNAANPEKRRATQLNWRARNTERLRLYTAERRARKRRAFVERVYVSVVARRDRGFCGICGKVVVRAERSLDHIVPLSCGGEHSYRNIQLTHWKCNNKRKNTGAGQPRLMG